MGCREQWKTVFVMIFVNFSFAVGNTLLKKIIDGGANHMAVVTYRLSTAAVFLVPIACCFERKSRQQVTLRILCYLFILAFTGAILTNYFALLGLEYTSATFVCLFNNMVPINTFILALLFGLEKVNIKSKAGKAKVLGAVICLSGTVLLTVYKGPPLTRLRDHVDHPGKNSQKHNWAIGSIFMIGSCVAFSSWFLIQAKIGEKFPWQYSSTAILSSFAAIQSAVITLILNRDMTVWILKGKFEIITIIFVGVVASGLCYAAMAWCVKQRGPLFTATFAPLTPIFAAIFDFSIQHQQIYAGSVVGSIPVIIGLYILLWGKSIDAKECARKEIVAKNEGNSDVESQPPQVTVNSTS